ncbi:MAG: hypothetical protein MJY62_00265 [Bacteroidales bacterium]|nr:hypothetical protein [Bacteroidales bacterium]
MRKNVLIQTVLAAMVFEAAVSFGAAAQNAPSTPEEREQKLIEMCEERVETMSRDFELEDWQAFYVDSILKHDYLEMQKEMEQLSRQRISNSSIYQDVQDKWAEQMDVAFRKVFNDTQWARYWKTGGEKAAKAREKRRLQAREALNPKEKGNKKHKK